MNGERELKRGRIVTLFPFYFRELSAFSFYFLLLGR